MTYDEFKLIYEDLMSNNKFDINNLIYEASKKWTLKDELLSIWPFVQEKFDQGFYDFFGNNKPGEPQYDPNSINSQLINAGTDKPGYIIKINLNDDYAKKLIDPMYEALENKKSYNNPLAPFIDKLRQSKKLNLLLEFYMYIKKPENKDAYDNKYDYQKSLVIEKNTVSGWEGMGFINFDLAAFGGPDRNKSKLKICKIDVSLSTNKSMMSKLSDLNSKYSNHVPDTKESLRLLGSAIGSLGKKISSIGSKKQNKVKAKFKLGSGLSNNRNVDVNISWENYKIENSEDLTLDNYKDGVNKQLQFIPTADHKILQKAIGKNWKTNIIFDKNNPDTNNNPHPIVLPFLPVFLKSHQCKSALKCQCHIFIRTIQSVLQQISDLPCICSNAVRAIQELDKRDLPVLRSCNHGRAFHLYCKASLFLSLLYH